MYPSHVTLTEEEKMNVCYLAFPDSNSGLMGDTTYHFRIQCTSPSAASSRPPAANELTSAKSSTPSSLSSGSTTDANAPDGRRLGKRLSFRDMFDRNCPAPLQSSSTHLFGFVYFRQVKDKSLPRSYFQKVSLVGVGN